ncbi:hypothetical protein FDECE_6452 [Fusarium decemcellulare]|nr:hypothetical protein FDECE_6452 [Fusarium decemcellulare]
MTEFVLYHYHPSLVAAIIFIVLFGLSAALHIFQLLRSRTWYFIPFIIGCAFEAVGYAGRAISATQSPDWATMPYAMQSLLLLLGPTLLAASIYMVLGRIIRLLDADSYSIIPPKWLTKFFVMGDVLSFFIQSGGGGILANAKKQKTVDLGQYVIIAGLGVQILFFGFFIMVTCIFHYRILALPTARSMTIQVPWKPYILVLYTASILIMIRSVFRVAEYVTGADGVLQAKEFYIYIFDGALMIITVVIFNLFHPSRIIHREAKSETDGSDDQDGAHSLDAMPSRAIA